MTRTIEGSITMLEPTGESLPGRVKRMKESTFEDDVENLVPQKPKENLKKLNDLWANNEVTEGD